MGGLGGCDYNSVGHFVVCAVAADKFYLQDKVILDGVFLEEGWDGFDVVKGCAAGDVYALLERYCAGDYSDSA